MSGRPAIFFDRDGVLNEVVFRGGKPASPRTLEEFTLTSGAVEATRRAREAGFVTCVVTNQPDVARGKMSGEALAAMHAVLAQAAPTDAVHACTHDDADACICRKPKPGALLTLAEEWGIDLARAYIVGDSWKDMDAGRAAGVTLVLVRRDYNEGVEADLFVDDVLEAVERILQREEIIG